MQQSPQPAQPPISDGAAQNLSELPAEDVRLRELTGRNIFLSYRSRDEPQVQGLRVLLGCLGNSVTKMGEFPPGRWGPYIFQRLADSDTLLIYLSKDPPRPRLRVAVEDGFRKLRRFWVEVVLRGNSRPNDWMREEFEHFRKIHGDGRDIIVYAEADAERPSHLREYQVHYFATQLTEVRETWARLRRQGIKRAEIKRVILDDLRKLGIALDESAKDAFFDMFGVTGIRSAGRYLWTSIYTTLSRLYLVAVTGVIVALVAGVGFSIPRLKIPVPDITKVTIQLNQDGRRACESHGLVCASVSQSSVSAGGVDKEQFYGYSTPTCESRLVRTTECDEWQADYQLSNVRHLRSNRSTVTDRIQDGRLCLSEPRYDSANCVNPLGD